MNFQFSILNFKYKITRNGGFTLIETLVALSVMLAAVVGPVALISRGIINTASAKNKLIALNLAQEGIELVRLVRENNVLCDSLNEAAIWEWDEDPDPPNPDPDPAPPNFGNSIQKNQNFIVNVNPSDATSFTSIDCSSLLTSIPPIFTPRLPSAGGTPPPLQFDSATGFYQYSSGPNSIFRRSVVLLNPAPPDPQINCTVGLKCYMDVESTVTWTERGIQKTVTLKERLFDWR